MLFVRDKLTSNKSFVIVDKIKRQKTLSFSKNYVMKIALKADGATFLEKKKVKLVTFRL